MMLSWQHQTSYTGFPRPRAVRSGSRDSVRREVVGCEVLFARKRLRSHVHNLAGIYPNLEEAYGRRSSSNTSFY